MKVANFRLIMEQIMIPKLELTELTDTELDTVCGSILNGFGNIVTQVNNATQVGVAVNLSGLVTNVGQILGQANLSL
jgi:hypothetical protein